MKFMDFFKDGTGALSSMRLTQVLVVTVILVVFILANIAAFIVAIKARVAPSAILDFPVQAVLLICAVIGGKVAQGALVEKGEVTKEDVK